MLSFYISFPLLVVVALFQSTVLGPLTVLDGRPDALFAVVVGWALLRGPVEAAVFAFVGGMVLDLLSGGPMGGITLALLVVAFIAGQRWGRELGSAVLQLVVMALILGFAYHVLILLALSWTGYVVDWGFSLARVAVPSAILNAVVAPFVYQPLVWLDRKTRPEGLTFDVRV